MTGSGLLLSFTRKTYDLSWEISFYQIWSITLVAGYLRTTCAVPVAAVCVLNKDSL